MESIESVREKVNEFIKEKFSYIPDLEFECSYKKTLYLKTKFKSKLKFHLK